MFAKKWRVAAFGAALFSASLTTTAVAHNDPREMGAGMQEEARHDEAEGQIGTPDVHDDDQVAMGKEMDHAAMGGEMDHGAMEGMADGHGADNSDKSFGKRLFIWLGKLHVAVIHFPIALIVAAFAAEALGVVRNRPLWRSAARIMLVIGALGAIVAAALGWFAGGFYLFDRNLILTAHRYLGMAIAVGSVILAWAGLRKFHHERRNDMMFAGLLGLLTIGVLVQAFMGGTFMHGGMNHMNF